MVRWPWWEVILSSSEGCSWSSHFRNSVIVDVTRLTWKPILVAMEQRRRKESRPRGEMENERMNNFQFYFPLLSFCYRSKSWESVFPALGWWKNKRSANTRESRGLLESQRKQTAGEGAVGRDAREVFHVWNANSSRSLHIKHINLIQTDSERGAAI